MALARFDRTVTDNEGNVVAGATVTVRLDIPGQPLAPLYSDRDGATPAGNPIATDANGDFGFFAAGGFYRIDVVNGADTKTLRYVGIGLAQGSDTMVTGTIERTVTDPGTVVVAADDADVILIKKTIGEATRVVYPLSASSTKKRRTVDRKFDAATNNITIVPSRPSAVTVTIASPAVFTKAAHSRAVNDPVSFETTGALPTGLSADVQYYVKTVPTADTFTVSETPGGAAINTTGAQSGVHKMGTDTIMGQAKYVIDSNGASIELLPLDDGSGWV
ncbi:hypothetical protein ABH999_006586 [Bradyrhizobium yuanmingense]|uniref:hypothetical protein n=1 Tax=Bradyrhizobium yuanmingense TaxID=108015 RepID=UPI003512CE74